MDEPDFRFRLGVIILGAGASSRMGVPKLLLRWENTTIIAHLVSVWRKIGAQQIGVVCAPDTPLAPELDRLGVPTDHQIINPNPERGMFSSIQIAASWNAWQRDLTHWAIVLGDQPQLTVTTLRTVVAFALAHRNPICQPAFEGKPRHPVILERTAFARLATTKVITLKEFLHQEQPAPALCDIDDPSLDTDLDTPADYQAALEAADRRVGL